ncbi:Uncharacterised protein [Klebsiella pneumoniae]|nr:Uncharacterised protein [Klebsiella pneumoniae]
MWFFLAFRQAIKQGEQPRLLLSQWGRNWLLLTFNWSI